MGDLVNLSDIIGEAGQPSVRAAALRIHSALAANEGQTDAVLVGQDKLQGELGKAADAKQDLVGRIAAEAAGLVAKMKQNVAWALGQTGSRGTVKAYEKLSVSSIQEAIGEAALKELAQELTRLSAERERLIVARAGVIREVVRESLQPALLSEYGDLLERLQETAARLRGLERYLTPPSADYQPNATRLAMLLPNFARGDGSEHAVTVEAREIQKVEAVLAAYAAQLERDPMSPCPELPELDQSADPSTTYDQLSPPEMAERDREAVFITTHRRTTNSMLFEEQLAEAKAFVGLTN